MSELTIKVNITRQQPSEDLAGIRVIDSSRCIFCYQQERLSVLLYNIEGGEAMIGESSECEITFLTGESIANVIANGDKFKLAIANEVIAEGEVTEVLIQ
jgi:hypothetical protein